MSPRDIIKRLTKAQGNQNIPTPTILLYEYLSREFVSKRFSPAISLLKTTENKPGLYWTIDEKYMRNNRKADVEQRFLKATNVVIKIGLLESYEIKKGSTGQPTAYFKLDKNWLKSTN